jgi:hypothetical protein
MFEEAKMALGREDRPGPTALIAVTQLPVIEERLREVKTEVELAVAEAKSMVATADTIQAVKNRRAELNKQFDALETQRKAVKEQIMEPYNRFEAVYRECITIPFKDADKSLKATVEGFESDVKGKMVQKLKDYYTELCEAERIDWLPFMRAMEYGNIKVGMTDAKKNSPRKLMDAVANVVSTIATGMDQIRKMEDSSEIMAEYKVCLDVGKAVANVQERKRAVEAEREAAEKQRLFEEKRAEAIAKLEATRTAQTLEAPTAVAPPRPLNKSMSFKIYFKTVEEYEKVKPILAQLKETLIKEGIKYE